MDNSILFSLKNRDVFDIRICRMKNSISTELDGETVILDLASGVYSGLDFVGTFIWNMLAETVSVSVVRDEILKKYDVNEEQCVVDLLSFLQKLADNGLITTSNEKNC